MKITNQIVLKHGLKLEEFENQIEYMIKAKLLLIQTPTNILSPEYILTQRVFLVIVVEL